MARTRTAQGVLRLLAADAAGSLLPIAAITLILLASLIGGGIDMSRAYQVKNRLQYACDAGVLAGRKVVEAGYNAENQTAVRDQADAFFKGNFDDDIESARGTSFTATSADGGNTIEGTANTNVDTIVMRIFGFDTIALTATCSASMSVGNSDVMMVLDVTGSMSSVVSDGDWRTDDPTRLEALQDAMKSFYDTVSASASGSTARIRYGFVPYSSTVNVGHLLQASWLVDSYKIESRKPDTHREQVGEDFIEWGPAVHTTDSGVDYDLNDDGDADYEDDEDWRDYSTNRYEDRDGCEDDMPNNTSWNNEGSPVTSDPVVEEPDDEGNRVTTITTTQLQSRTTYDCDRRGNGKKNRYYVIVYWEIQREAYSSEIYTQKPITEPIFDEVFDGWTYQERTFDVSQFKTGATVSANVGYEGADISSTWNGCIEERETNPASSFSYSTLADMDPYPYDLDLDLIPDATDPDTQWRPMWPEVSFLRYRRSRYGSQLTQDNVSVDEDDDEEENDRNGPLWQTDAFCPRPAQLLTEMTEDAFDDYADALTPVGSTYHDIGMIWGGRLASPEGLFASNVTAEPTNGGAVARHLIFMTDGQMQPSTNIYSAYGIEFYDERVTGGSSGQTSRHNSRFLAVCEAIRAKGIRIWVIAFGTELTSNLEACASDDSAYTAQNSAQLNSAFQEIAKDVGELRIVQ